MIRNRYWKNNQVNLRIKTDGKKSKYKKKIKMGPWRRKGSRLKRTNA